MSGEWLTVAEIADSTGFSARTILRWIEKGSLRAVRFPGGRLRVAQVDLAAMLEAGATSSLGKAYAVPSNAGGPAALSTPRPVATEVESGA